MRLKVQTYSCKEKLLHQCTLYVAAIFFYAENLYLPPGIVSILENCIYLGKCIFCAASSYQTLTNTCQFMVTALCMCMYWNTCISIAIVYLTYLPPYMITVNIVYLCTLPTYVHTRTSLPCWHISRYPNIFSLPPLQCLRRADVSCQFIARVSWEIVAALF